MVEILEPEDIGNTTEETRPIVAINLDATTWLKGVDKEGTRKFIK